MSADAWSLLFKALWETLYMVVSSGVISFALGIPLGVLLYVTRTGRILEMPLPTGLWGRWSMPGVPFHLLS